MQKLFIQIGAAIFVGIAVTATVVEYTRTADAPPRAPVQVASPSDASSTRDVLRRCRDLGEAATRHPTCLKAWTDNLDRFLGREAAAPTSQARPSEEAR